MCKAGGGAEAGRFVPLNKKARGGGERREEGGMRREGG